MRQVLTSPPPSPCACSFSAVVLASSSSRVSASISAMARAATRRFSLAFESSFLLATSETPPATDERHAEGGVMRYQDHIMDGARDAPLIHIIQTSASDALDLV